MRGSGHEPATENGPGPSSSPSPRERGDGEGQRLRKTISTARRSSADAMNISAPFIRRPIGTTCSPSRCSCSGPSPTLPARREPAGDRLPGDRRLAARPGADPATMAASVAAPLERRLSGYRGVTELTSVSSLGQTQIVAQFDLNRNIDSAARDVQAAINAAATDLPSDLPILPTFRKASPATSLLVLALTSETLPTTRAIFDAPDTVIAQRISQVSAASPRCASPAPSSRRSACRSIRRASPP